MTDYLCVFIAICDYLSLYIFIVCLKCAKRLIDIYLHNNLRHIACLYTLLYILIMQLRLKNAYLFA